ncbi:FliI/YscN family ATPase [Pyrinomonas methylaliphatogenes]|uniref:Type III secretion system ATPase, FliI/YscN n=1 Tax=Pyrinomonas methylaliphatogenes TaxID=454194 RepID=A0A0B6WZC9_9BACT|nr:FliI/YscN family ATPase [Pyrinomonas methylaliphatogenes]CDM65639.1 type III secretion system ATPase, FliI/YscN [Pyrinomonas methylaliphatogenes]
MAEQLKQHDPSSPLARYFERLAKVDPLVSVGTVTRAIGMIIESRGPAASVGELCRLERADGDSLPLEVVGFRDSMVLTMPLGAMPNLRAGDRVIATGSCGEVGVGTALLGRVIDALGRPLDDHGPITPSEFYPLRPDPVNPLARANITDPLSTGVRAIDGLLTIGKGQRIGIFGGSGVGKSTLLGMMAKRTAADLNVIALIGERGREVRGFIERELGEEGMRRSVVLVSTSDDSPLVRIRAALAATAIAEYFKDQGADVLLIMDSVTRFAMAQREIGLAAGEPPSSRGYTPSVFALLPRLLERAGNFADAGSITAFYTVLVEGDDMNEPIADAVRSILDGHIVLSRALAARNHYPCIDVLHSTSRLFTEVTSMEHRAAAGRVRELLAAYERAEDLINIGAYQRGSNPRVDEAIARHDAIISYLKQDRSEIVDYETAITQLIELAK